MEVRIKKSKLSYYPYEMVRYRHNKKRTDLNMEIIFQRMQTEYIKKYYTYGMVA